jgi:transposase, IS5 family
MYIVRKMIEPQMKFGQVDIADIRFDPRSRDEIPQLLEGLQNIWCDRATRDAVFQEIEAEIGQQVNIHNGRPGMELWRILVLGTLRLACNWDYDKLHEIANNHKTLRALLGHSSFEQEDRYALQTIKDNIALFTPELLKRINRIVVERLHRVIGVKVDEGIHGSCDSFVVETNVHYPTDTGLLWDAVRRMILLTMALCNAVGKSEWRQGSHQLRKLKKALRTLQQRKRSVSHDTKVKLQKEQEIRCTYQECLDLACSLLARVRVTLKAIETPTADLVEQIKTIEGFADHAKRQIEQIHRRVMDGEAIPHQEKVFSIFEPHTEWISKGKAGVPVELGLKVSIVKDQFGGILNHRVMQHETDDQVAVPLIKETKDQFPNLKQCSFDKGFHSLPNQERLAELLDDVILPRKGKLSAAALAIENTPTFIHSRRKHSAVESAINALENHGLDRCPDQGIAGFKRYVALAVLARNIQLIGALLQKRRLQEIIRLGKVRQRVQQAA